MTNPLVARVMAVNEWNEEKVYDEACKHQEKIAGEYHCALIIRASACVKGTLPEFVTKFCHDQITEYQQLKLNL